MYNSDMNNCRRYQKTRIINKILEDNFEKFKQIKLIKLKNKEMREHIKNVVEKALTCGNIDYGYVKYKCLECNEEYIHGLSCKSKFCTKCGRMYSINWAEKQSQNMLNVKHRHAVFTIPEELRNYFYKKRKLIKDLQDAVYQVISYYYKTRVKGNHEVGVITVVHTFGSDLKWNPHIHALVTEG
ncbi:IS91 family transposase, partial [Intestinibacter sp.]